MKRFLLASAVLFLSACSPRPQQYGVHPTPLNNEEAQAVIKAKELWQEKKYAKADLSNGPCLSNQIIPDWVADIAHQPRLPVDDDPANQCSAFVKGQAHHFVELDPNGNFLRAY